MLIVMTSNMVLISASFNSICAVVMFHSFFAKFSGVITSILNNQHGWYDHTASIRPRIVPLALDVIILPYELQSTTLKNTIPSRETIIVFWLVAFVFFFLNLILIVTGLA